MMHDPRSIIEKQLRMNIEKLAQIFKPAGHLQSSEWVIMGAFNKREIEVWNECAQQPHPIAKGEWLIRFAAPEEEFCYADEDARLGAVECSIEEWVESAEFEGD